MRKLFKTVVGQLNGYDLIARQKMLALSMAILAWGAFDLSPLIAFQGSAKEDSATQLSQVPDEQTEIDVLIRQLGSSNFTERQIAVEQLWQFGNKARRSLERASKNADPEVSRRAKEILTVLTMGIDSETNPELAKLILRFNGSERSVQASILGDLLNERKLKLVMELLEQLDSETDQKYLFKKVLPMESTIIDYGRTGRWEDLEFILNHPFTFEYEPTTLVQYQMAKQELEPLIERLKKKIEEVEADGKKVEPKMLNLLIAILTMERRFDEAELYVAKIKKDSFRNIFQNQLLFEKGDWSAIYKKLAKEEDDLNDGKGLISVTESQRAMVAKFVGDEKAYQDVVAKMLEKANEAKKEKDKETERQWLDALVEIGFMNLDWDLANKYLNREANETFELLIGLRRNEDAFKLIELGDTVEKRDLWFTRKMRYIRTLRAKIVRLDDRGEDSDQTSYKLQYQWDKCLSVANILGQLGHIEEAVAHFHTLFANYEAEEYVEDRALIIWRLILMGQYAEASRLAEKGFRQHEYSELLDFIFPVQKDAAAAYWFGLLNERYPDSYERTKVTAGIVCSPFCDLPDFDLDYELANIQPPSKAQKSGFWDYQLAKVYEFHGRQREFDLHMEVSRQLGYLKAKEVQVRKSVENNEYDEIIKYYDTTAYNRSGFGPLITAEAFMKKGDVRNAALRRVLAFAYWGNSYRNSSVLSSLQNIDKKYLAADFLKLQLYQIDDVDESSITNERYRQQLSEALLENEPELAVFSYRIYLFNHAATDDPGVQSDTEWLDLVVTTEKARARALISKGRFKEAADVILKCDAFAPGDPGIGEKLLTELDEAGGSAEADRVFNQMSRFYFDILQRHPDSSLHHNNYAWLCACAKRRTKHMQRHAELAVALRPNTTSYLDTLAFVYYLKGEKGKAIKSIKKAIQLYPTKQHYRDQLKLFEGSASSDNSTD